MCRRYFIYFVFCFLLIGSFGYIYEIQAEGSKSLSKVKSSIANVKTNVSAGTQSLDSGASIDFKNGFAGLAEKLLPTVVNISTTHKIEKKEMPKMPQFGPNSPFNDMFKDFFEQQENSPRQRNVSSLGSGFVIDAKNGYIVTNNHVIDGADDVKVLLHDDTSLDAKVVGSDKKTDIAVLQVTEKNKLIAVNWGDSDTTRVGHWVMAIGNPFGLGGTVTAGIVSARQRDIHAGPYDDFIQTDASINRGNSGGPMFNTNGEVIGVNTAIFSPTGGSVGIGFAVPSNLVKNVVKQLIEYGKTKRGWLGVRIQTVTDDIAEGLGMTKKMGALVSSISEDGPAAKSDIKSGDVIIEFDGKEINEMRQLPRIVAETEVGKTADIVLLRKGKKVKTKVRLGELEKAEENGFLSGNTSEGSNGEDKKDGLSKKVDALGLSVSRLTDALRNKYGIDEDIKGLIVTDVVAGGSADDKAVRKGDVIIEAGQKKMDKVSHLESVVKDAVKRKKKSLLLLLSRDGDLRFIGLRLDSK